MHQVEVLKWYLDRLELKISNLEARNRRITDEMRYGDGAIQRIRALEYNIKELRGELYTKKIAYAKLYRRLVCLDYIVCSWRWH